VAARRTVERPRGATRRGRGYGRWPPATVAKGRLARAIGQTTLVPAPGGQGGAPAGVDDRVRETDGRE
jgi:hypothetical protein